MGRQDVFDAIDAGDDARLAGMLSADRSLAGERDAEGVSAALHARYRNRHRAVELLLAAGPTLDVFDAAALGRPDRVRQLIAEDPGLVSAFSRDGFTALHLAAFFGQAESAGALLDLEAPVDVVSRNEMKVMPLHSAAAGRHADVARLLVEADADVNATQRHGYTPLHAAAENGDVELAELLLDAGADPAARTDDGRTAADMAVAAGHPMFAQRLRAAAARA
jgi:ankyrin repeat protein